MDKDIRILKKAEKVLTAISLVVVVIVLTAVTHI